MKRTKSDRSNTSSTKRRARVSDDDDGSDVSKGTNDSFMDELKSKNEGTYKWEDVKKRRSAAFEVASGEEDESFTSLKERERQRRQAKRKANSPVASSKNPAKQPK